MHRLLRAAALASALLAAQPAFAETPASPPAPPANSAADPDGWGAYDFLIGDWTGSATWCGPLPDQSQRRLPAV